jgi:acyl carrier protein
MSVRSTVTSQFQKVASEQKKPLARLSDDLKLLESGFDSLDFALIIAYLENALGYDPFEDADDSRYPVTFGDFVKLYENHAKSPS